VKRAALAAVLCLAGLAVLAGRSTAAPANGPIAVKLPKHVWGHFQEADIRDVSAKWGTGAGRVGLVHAEAGPTGGSSFDVVNGIVCVLDQHNGRVLVFDPRKKPRAVPLKVAGSQGAVFRGVDSSLAVATDGKIYVAEPADSAHSKPVLRVFAASGGAPTATVPTLGTNPVVRASGKTAYAAQLLSGPWKTSASAGVPKAGPSTPYRPYADGSHIQVAASTSQPIVVTLRRSDKTTLSWRITSPDHISVDDAESFGGIEAVVALRVNADGRKTEYELLILGPHGILHSFSAPDDEYTSTALFDDWRVEGSTIYHRGSTKTGLYVDEFQF
jgi:hypothetical protein